MGLRWKCYFDENLAVRLKAFIWDILEHGSWANFFIEVLYKSSRGRILIDESI